MVDKFDKNLSVESTSVNDMLQLYNVTQKPFKIYGNCIEAKNAFSRMPEDIAQTISEGVYDRAKRSAGIRIRFKTNSRQLGLKVRFFSAVQFPAQSAISTKGFDVYVDKEYFCSIFAQDSTALSYEQVIDFGNINEKEITIYCPYNAVVEEVFLALEKDAFVAECDDYAISVPIVFYGSSITHGFCVSRPGNTFTAMLSRRLNADYINLGFSGVCRGEKTMAQYLANLKKSVFVCGYDHNEQCLADLQERHLPFYQSYREIDVESPIVFVSSPNSICKGEVMYERMKTVEATYNYALKNGDRKVFFVDGQKLYPENIRFDCSADAIHPNDLGAYMIAEGLYNPLRKILYQ